MNPYRLLAEPKTWGELKRAIAELPDDTEIHWINQHTQALYVKEIPEEFRQIVGFQ